MREEKLLTIREVSLICNISEKEVIELAESQVIPAYRIGGVYLRFKRQQIEEYRKKIKSPVSSKNNTLERYSLKDQIFDFIYFNDFYILSVFIVIVIIVILFQGY